MGRRSPGSGRAAANPAAAGCGCLRPFPAPRPALVPRARRYDDMLQGSGSGAYGKALEGCRWLRRRTRTLSTPHSPRDMTGGPQYPHQIKTWKIKRLHQIQPKHKHKQVVCGNHLRPLSNVAPRSAPPHLENSRSAASVSFRATRSRWSRPPAPAANRSCRSRCPARQRHRSPDT